MATALFPLRRVQYGRESAAGTAVAAETALSGEGYLAPSTARWRPAPRLSARADAAGLVDTSRTSLLVWESGLDFEQVMLFLETGLAGAMTTGTGPYTHTYTPDLLAAPTIGSATFEYAAGDGTTDHLERRFAFGTTRRITIELARDQRARLACEVFGRADEPTEVATGLAGPTSTSIASSDFTIAIDEAWNDLGVSPKTLPVEFATLDLLPGLEPDFTLDGRDELDFTRLRWSRLRGVLRMTVEHTADADTEVEAWRQRAKRFMRLEATSGSKLLRFDLAGVYATEPRMTRERDRELVTLALVLDYDRASARILEATVVNDVAGL